MTEEGERESVLVREFYRWKQLVSYPEWEEYIQLLREHCIFLQKEVNRCVREGNKEGAMMFLAQKEQIPKLLGKVKDKMTLKKEER